MTWKEYEQEQNDLDQLRYIAEWRKTHKRWMVKCGNRIRYFGCERSARVYAAWMKLLHRHVEVEREQ